MRLTKDEFLEENDKMMANRKWRGCSNEKDGEKATRTTKNGEIEARNEKSKARRQREKERRR